MLAVFKISNYLQIVTATNKNDEKTASDTNLKLQSQLGQAVIE